MTEIPTPAAVVESAAGDFMAGRPDRAGALIIEQSDGDRLADLTQTALVAGGQVLRIIHEAAGVEVHDALIASIRTTNSPKPALRAVVADAMSRHSEPDFALSCRRAADRLISDAGEMALDAALDPVLALAALVMQFDDRDNILSAACRRAERVIVTSEGPFQLVWAQLSGDADGQQLHLQALADALDPAGLLVWYFGLAYDLTGRTDAGGENPALDVLAGDIAAGSVDTAQAIAKGFASRVEPRLVIAIAASHVTKAIIAEANRRGVDRRAVLEELRGRVVIP